jgi:hypothetical protein
MPRDIAADAQQLRQMRQHFHESHDRKLFERPQRASARRFHFRSGNAFGNRIGMTAAQFLEQPGGENVAAGFAGHDADLHEHAKRKT